MMNGIYQRDGYDGVLMSGKEEIKEDLILTVLAYIFIRKIVRLKFLPLNWLVVEDYIYHVKEGDK